MKKHRPCTPPSAPANSPIPTFPTSTSNAFQYALSHDTIAYEFGEFFSFTEVQNEVSTTLASFVSATAPHCWMDVPVPQQLEWIEEWAMRLEFGEPVASRMLSVNDEVFENCQQQHQAAEALAALAMGAGHLPFTCHSSYAIALCENAELLWHGGVLPSVLILMCSLLAAHRDSGGSMGELPKILLGHNCTIIFALLLAAPDRAALRQVLLEFEFEGQSFLVFLFHVLKDRTVEGANTATPFLPLKKLLLILWRTLEVIFPDAAEDLFDSSSRQSGVKVFPGDVTNYIIGACKTSACAELTPEYLLLYYYGCFDGNEHPAFAPFVRSDYAAFDELAIPFPVQEALHVIAQRHQEQYSLAVQSGKRVLPLQLSEVSTAFPPPNPAREGIQHGKLPEEEPIEEEEEEEEEDEEGTDVFSDRGAPPRVLLDLDTPAEELYRALLPIMSPVLLCLLRPFLAALPNATSNQLDLAADLPPTSEGQYPETQQHGAPERQNLELKRHKEIVLKAVAALLLLLLQVLHQNHPLQGACLAEGVCSANGLLLLLKYLNQRDPVQFVCCPLGDVATVELSELEHCPASLMISHDAFRGYLMAEEGPIGGATSTLTSELGPPMKVISRCVHACISCTQLLHKLTKRNVTRLAVLAGYKVHVMMKRLLRLPEPILTRYASKVLKAVQRSTGRKWRAANMKVYSVVYREASHTLSDCHLYSETSLEAADPLSLPVPLGHHTDQEVSRSIQSFNRREYSRYMELGAAATPPPDDEDFHATYLQWYAARYGNDRQ